MTYYVHIEKEDGKGKTLGSAYHGTIHDSDEAITAVSESLDKCGSNLTCYNPFTLSKYG